MPVHDLRPGDSTGYLELTAPYVLPPAPTVVTMKPVEYILAASSDGYEPEPERPCACVPFQTELIRSTLTYDSQRKLYGGLIAADARVPWPLCKVCGGTGVDRRP